MRDEWLVPTFPCRSRAFALLAASLFSVPASAQPADAPAPDAGPARASHAMVVTIHHDATDAGVEILRAGGNAVDAAVAVGFALAVVLPQAGNIGGGGFMLIRPAPDTFNRGQATFLDYRETAPAGATADMYLDRERNVVPGRSTVGYLAAGVPGSVAGLTYAEARFGKLGLGRVMAPAIRLAREGYQPGEEELRTFRTSQRLAQFPDSRRIFQRDGNFYQPGERLLQPELARTLERIAADPADFYRGRMARQIADFMGANGGLITAADLAAYQCKERVPLVGHYHGCEVVTAPPPSSGGIVLLEILNILSGYDLPKLGPDRGPAQVHVITEAFRRAYMDRGDYLGDPDFVQMPLAQMADPAYAAAWRQTIDPVRPTASAALVRPAGFLPSLPAAPAAHESPQTTHFSVVDAEGNAVASTYTLNFPFGAGVTVPGLGFLLNDEMDDFASKRGAPNGFGLVQGPANAIAPGKRPLSSMTPTIVSAAAVGATPGRLRLVLGTPGGSTIITTVANDLVSMLDNGLDVQAAADAPRFHHQFLPDLLQVEKAFPRATTDALAAAGYPLKFGAAFDEDATGVWGDSELIAVDPKTGELRGGQDHRHAFGKAAGY